jgi:hypothetical protein
MRAMSVLPNISRKAKVRWKHIAWLVIALPINRPRPPARDCSEMFRFNSVWLSFSKRWREKRKSHLRAYWRKLNSNAPRPLAPNNMRRQMAP